MRSNHSVIRVRAARLSLPALLTTILLAVASQAVCQPSESLAKVAVAVEDALRRGDPPAAEKLLAPFLAAPRLAELSTRDRIEVLRLWGEILLERNDPERAIAAFEEAHGLASGEAKAALTLELAQGHLAVSDPEGARRLLESLGDADRERPQAKFLGAVVVYAVEDREEARRRFEALLRDEPVAEAAHYLGVLAYERVDLEEALKRFSAAIELDPRDYYSRVYRCRCLLDLHRVTEAERELRELKARQPTPEVRCLLGRALMRQRRDEDALAEFRAAIRERPSYAEALFGEAGVLRRLGKTDEAREVTDRFRRVHLRQDADRRRLESLHQKSLRSPDRWEIPREMAELSRAAGDLEAAERHAWRAVRLVPREASCRLLLARVFADQGRYQAAAVQYQRILRDHPDHDGARVELERLVREHGRRER